MRSSGSCRRHPSSCVRRSSSLRKPPGDASTTLSSRNHPERFSSETQKKSTSPEVLPLPPLTPAPVSFKFPQVLSGPSRFLQVPPGPRSGSAPPPHLPRGEGHTAGCSRAVVVGLFFVVVAVCLQPLCHSHPICDVIHLD